MAKDKNYILLFIAFGFIFGSFNGLGAVLSFIFEPYGFTAADNSIAVSIIVLGVVGTIASSLFLKNHKVYRKFILILTLLSIGSMFLIIR